MINRRHNTSSRRPDLDFEQTGISVHTQLIIISGAYHYNLLVVTLKASWTEDTSWPENVQVFASACFIWLLSQYSYKRSHGVGVVGGGGGGFIFELLRVQPRWFTLYQWRAEKGWLPTYLILSPHMPAVLMSLTQTPGQAIAVLWRAHNVWGVQFHFKCL